MSKTAKTIVHVNQHMLKYNKKHGTDEPVITIKKGKTNTYCYEVKILSPATVKYGGNDKPLLSCGARVVIETEGEVEVVR